MPIGKIESKFFLSPREAIDELVGPATHGDAWKLGLPADDDRVRSALRNLYKALQSGNVAAFHHAFDGHERQLSAAEAANEFFKIDLKRDGCLFGPIEGPPQQLKINRADLIAFLEAVQSARVHESGSDLDQCAAWLIERLSTSGRRPVNKDLRPEAKKHWPNLSERGYQNARGIARSKMGKSASEFSGRPRGAKPSHSA